MRVSHSASNGSHSDRRSHSARVAGRPEVDGPDGWKTYFSEADDGPGRRRDLQEFGGANRILVRIKTDTTMEELVADRIVAAFKTSPKVTIKVYLDVVTMNRGKVDVALFFAGIGGSFSTAFERGVATRIAARTASVH